MDRISNAQMNSLGTRKIYYEDVHQMCIRDRLHRAPVLPGFAYCQNTADDYIHRHRYCECFSGLPPVSYTHLDVYKRQEERYLKNQYTTRLRKALCQDGDEMNTHFYQGKDFSLGQVIDLAETRCV